MTRRATLALAALLALMLAGGNALARGHGGGHGFHGGFVGGHVHSRVVVGGAFFVGPGFYYPPYYYPPYYYYPPPAYYPPAPPVYIEQGAPPAYPAPPGAAPQSQQYWYFCRSANGYYPNVQACPEGWQRVAPQPPS